MYQVIARTWRPQRFSEVVGQQHVTQTLQNAIRLGRIAHGYIFSGQRGVGKTSVARLLAKSLNCATGPAPEPCGECDSCREVAAGRAVDVIEIDAASNRGIDAVRELRENARYAPARDRYKVFIIDEAHQITPEGFNALLKTLEEPPPHVIFILATTEAHQFPETILSRCQHFSFRAIPFPEILGHIEAVCAGEKVEADPDAVAALARSGEGSLRDALSRLEQAIAAFGSRLEGPAVRRLLGTAPTERLEEVFQAVREQNRQRMLDIVEQLSEEGSQLPHFCSQLVRTARNLLVARVTGPRQDLLESSAEESARLAALAGQFSEESLMRILGILLELNQELRHSMDPRFQMELGLLKLVDAERLVAIEDLLAQMEPGNVSREKSSPAPSASPRPPVPAEKTARATASGRLSPFEQDQMRKRTLSEAGIGAATGTAPAAAAQPAKEAVREAPAAAPSPPAEDRSGDTQAPDAISEICRRLEERSKPFLASLLVGSSDMEVQEGEVTVRLADPGMAAFLPDPDRQLLHDLFTEVLGRKVKVSLVAAAPGEPAKKREPQGVPASSADQRIHQDPEVKEFEALFGKPVTGIRHRKE